MTLSNLIAISILAVLTDRLVLDRILGHTPPGTSAGTIAHLLKTGTVPCLLALAACSSWVIADFVLLPAGTGYLIPIVFMLFIVLFAVAGEALLSRREDFMLLNRLSQRAIALGILIGQLAVVPAFGHDANNELSLERAAGCGVFAGLVFAAVSLLHKGIAERISPTATSRPRSSLPQELATAGLLALALGGFSGIRIF